MILLIDNYDSFTYNLVQELGTLEKEIRTVRNDQISIEEIRQLAPSHLVLSPGPGYPKDAGICEEVIRSFQGQIPILGICLGHQAICEVYGAKIAPAEELMHGKKSRILLDSFCTLFHGLGRETGAARYHSLAAVKETIPEELKITALSEAGEVMAVAHREYPVYGLQFHPESILTEKGMTMLENFLKCTADNQTRIRVSTNTESTGKESLDTESTNTESTNTKSTSIESTALLQQKGRPL